MDDNSLKRYIILIGFWAIGNLHFGLAQKPFLAHWDTNDGLSEQFVHTILQDQFGFIWVGTTNGLCRFDGQTFEVFHPNPVDSTALCGSDVVRLHEDPHGRIWVGTEGGGISIFDYQKNGFTTLRKNQDDPIRGLTEDRVYHISTTADHSEMLIGYRAIGSGRGGISIWSLEGDTIVEHALRDQPDYAGFVMKVTRLQQDVTNPDIFWLGGRSFFRWDRRQNTYEEFPLAKFRPNLASVCGILPETDSTLLVGNLFEGLWRFNTQKKAWSKLLHDRPVNSMKQTAEGEIWLLDNEGVGRWNREKEQLEYVIYRSGPDSPFPEGIVLNSIELIGDFLWINTTQGLYCWHPIFQQFNNQTLNLTDGRQAYLPQFTGTLDSDYLILDQRTGLVQTTQDLQLIRTINMPGDTKPRKAIQMPSGEVWLGGESGVFRWRPGDTQIQSYRNDQLDEVQVWSMKYYPERPEELWIGTRHRGLFCLNTQSDALQQFVHDKNNPLSLCHDRYLFEIELGPQGHLWVCTDKGISIIDPVSKQFIQHPVIEGRLGEYVVHAIEMDDQNNMWIGTRDHGLFKYQLKDQALKQYTTMDGLFYNGVNEMLFEDGHLWLCTRQGLNVLQLPEEEMLRFNRNKGLYEKYLYSSLLSHLPGGEVMLTYQFSPWFSTIKLDQLTTQFEPPEIAIETARVFNNSQTYSIPLVGQSTVTLSADENYFSIDYQGIHFLQSKSIQYEYQLEGYDDNWIQAGENKSAVYTNLPGGDYQFRVRARHNGGEWNTPSRIGIFLATPWYKTWTFLVFCVASGLGLFWLFYRYRLRQTRREADFRRRLAETEMRALRSQMNPHFIFNGLNSIKNYIIQNDTEAGTLYVSRFARLIRKILNHSSEQMISLEDELSALKLYIWLESERLQHQFSVEYNIQLQSEVEELSVPPLLIQPFVENAIWHGLMPAEHQGKIVLEVLEADGLLNITIKDNGIGRAAARQRQLDNQLNQRSLGLELSRSRLGQLKTLFDIDTSITIEDLPADRSKEFVTIVRIQLPLIHQNTKAYVHRYPR